MFDKIDSGVTGIIKFIEYVKNNSFVQITKYVLQLAVWIVIIVSAFNYRDVFSWVYNTTTSITKSEHDKLTEYRISINDEVNDLLQKMCKECGGSRSYILEFHNGTNNPAGLPFYYMNMTYEYTDIERTYSGASEWSDLLISRFNLVSKYYNDGVFVGSTDDVMKIDSSLAHKLKSNDVKYMGCILLYGTNKPIGILGVSTERDSDMSYDTVKNILIKYSHKIVKLLDAEALNL